MAPTVARCSPQEVLQAELKKLFKAGFPLTDARVGDILTEQRVVIAHAQHPEERASRVSALDRVVRQLLNDLGPSARGQAARILFGSARGTRGMTLTARRLQAAEVLERHEDHLRKQIEPRLLEELAFAFHQENLRYKPVAEQVRPAIAAHDDTPVITEDSYTEQEELLCRVWSAVYGYRAELIATELRLREARTEEREPDADLKEHLDTGTWQLARLLTFVSDYLDRYGEEILHGETPFNVEGLVALAGWHGGLGGDDAKRLRYLLARAGPDDRNGFLELLHPPATTKA
jgi:hypothetical protein